MCDQALGMLCNHEIVSWEMRFGSWIPCIDFPTFMWTFSCQYGLKMNSAE